MKNYKKELLILIESLQSLLNYMRLQKEEAYENMRFSTEGIPFGVGEPIDKINHKISRLEKLLSIPNESIDFLKELIKVDKVFKNSESFPDFRNFIPAREIIYADIENNIDEIVNKTNELRDRNHIIAYKKASEMISELRTLNNMFFLDINNNGMYYHDYKSKALDIINEARPELERHRGFKQILLNLLVIIASLGIAPLINKSITGKFLFYKKTDSSEKLDNLSNAIDDKYAYFPGVANRKE